MAKESSTKAPQLPLSPEGQAPRGPNPPDLTAAIAAEVKRQLTAQLAELQRTLPRKVLTGDDQIFLAWVLGFTAGAHLEKDGGLNERIFARCRQISEKLPPVAVGDPGAAVALGGS